MSSSGPDPIHRTASVADAAKFDWELRLLCEVVDFGARLLQRFVEGRKMGHTEGCVVVLAGQTLAMADAVEVLLRAGTASGARVPMRALFESQLYLQWILAKDTDHRALCWWAHVKRRERDEAAMLVRTTRDGLAFEERLKRAGMSPAAFTDPSMQAQWIKRLDDLEARCRDAAWASIKDTGDRWYRAAGANSIRDVAVQAGQELLYEVFFSLLCRDVHSSNPERWLTIKAGKGEVQAIRHMVGIRMLLQFALPLLFDLYSTLIRRFMPAEEGAYVAQRVAWGPRLSAIRDAEYIESDEGSVAPPP